MLLLVVRRSGAGQRVAPVRAVCGAGPVSFLARLRAALVPAAASADAETLRCIWEHLYDTEPGSEHEDAAYRAYQLASGPEERAA